jgi:hypothetical protein
MPHLGHHRDVFAALLLEAAVIISEAFGLPEETIRMPLRGCSEKERYSTRLTKNDCTEYSSGYSQG